MYDLRETPPFTSVISGINVFYRRKKVNINLKLSFFSAVFGAGHDPRHLKT